MLLSHVWGLFAHPREEFQLIQKEQAERPNLYISYILILAAIPPISIYIGAAMIGWRIGDGDITRMTTSSTISLCVLMYFAIIAEIYVLGRARAARSSARRGRDAVCENSARARRVREHHGR